MATRKVLKMETTAKNSGTKENNGFAQMVTEGNIDGSYVVKYSLISTIPSSNLGISGRAGEISVERSLRLPPYSRSLSWSIRILRAAAVSFYPGPPSGRAGAGFYTNNRHMIGITNYSYEAIKIKNGC